MWPRIRSTEEKHWYEIAARVFYSAERPTVNGNLPSKLVYQQLREGATKAIPLLSYRVNFYVISHNLAEKMVSSCLCYIVYINQGRNLLRTVQPSEPVLAYTAATRMSNPTTRFSALHVLKGA